MKSIFIVIAVLLVLVAFIGCKDEEQVDLTPDLVGKYSGEFTWDMFSSEEVKKANGVVTIKKIDETHVEITDDIGKYHFDFVVVSERDSRDGSINFSQIIKNPDSKDKYFGWLYAYGNRNGNKLYIRFNGIYFTGDLIQ